MLRQNPCHTCGACCAHYRVSFYWAETDPLQGGSVPVEETEPVDDFRRCMRGTNQRHPHCVELQGNVGGKVACGLYARRASPCREFGVHWYHSGLYAAPESLQRCNEARAAWGLPPLEPQPPLPHHAASPGRLRHHARRTHSHARHAGCKERQPV